MQSVPDLRLGGGGKLNIPIAVKTRWKFLGYQQADLNTKGRVLNGQQKYRIAAKFFAAESVCIGGSNYLVVALLKMTIIRGGVAVWLWLSL